MVEEVLLPFLLKSCSGSNPLEHQPGVHKLLDLMWVCMEVWLCNILGNVCEISRQQLG